MKELRKLQEQAPKNVPIGFGFGSMDEHSGWGVDPDMEDIISEEIRGMIREAATHARSSNSWGSISADMQKAIDEYLKSEVDWRAVLKMFQAKTRALDPISTMRRVSKRAPYQMPGARRTEIANIVWFVDQSGSMSDDSIARGLAEGLNCSRTGQIDIMNFDTSIDESSFHTVKRGSGFKWLRTRCGGTNFDCVADYLNDPANKNKYSAAVVVTDGYALSMKHCKIPILWLVTPDGTMDAVRPGDLVIRMGTGEQVRRHVG
jgi:predicted metal-dependent peptidase